MGVKKEDLAQVVFEKKIRALDQILDETRACEGCGTCFNEIRAEVLRLLSLNQKIP